MVVDFGIHSGRSVGFELNFEGNFDSYLFLKSLITAWRADSLFLNCGGRLLNVLLLLVLMKAARSVLLIPLGGVTTVVFREEDLDPQREPEEDPQRDPDEERLELDPQLRLREEELLLELLLREDELFPQLPDLPHFA